MNNPGQGELERRLEQLAPFLRDLGVQILEAYAGAGILAALPDTAFPVADARFHRRADGFAYHLHGAAYFNVIRSGGLELAGPGAGVPLTDALLGYVRWARRQDLEDTEAGEGATEWYPPPRLILDAGTSRLYIAAIGRAHHHCGRWGFMPVDQYLEERAQLFVDAFRTAI